MIQWSSFAIVVVAALVAACLLVTLFAAALRVGDGEGPLRRVGSVALFVLCGAAVLFGIYLIVPVLHMVG